MDEYLDEEVEAVKHAFDVICKGWDRKVCIHYLFLTDLFYSWRGLGNSLRH
jgi:hypothetical protein